MVLQIAAISQRQHGQLRLVAACIIELRAQSLKLGNVALLDIGEVRDIALGGSHVLGDPSAQADDLDRLVRASGPSGGMTRLRAIGDVRVEIGVPNASLGAGAHIGEVDCEIGRALAHRRGGENLGARGFRNRCRSGFRSRSRLRLRLGRGRRRCLVLDRFGSIRDVRRIGRLDLDPLLDRVRFRGWRLGGRIVSHRLIGLDHLVGHLTLGFDDHEHRTDRDDVPRLAGNLEHLARNRAFHLYRRFVGHHVGDLLIFLDTIAGLHVHRHDLGLGDALADVGQVEGKASHQASRILSIASPMRTGPGK